MTPQQRLQEIHKRLTEALSPKYLEIIDESHYHEGHPGAQSGGGHFKIIIDSEQFLDKNEIARHRLVYAALGDLMLKEIHAVTIYLPNPSL